MTSTLAAGDFRLMLAGGALTWTWASVATARTLTGLQRPAPR
jgi:hypothetical protein